MKPRTRTTLLAAAITALLLLAACAEDDAGASASAGSTDLPEWVERVYPAPGQDLATNPDVQVEHDLSAPDEGIRLSIDGVDVTAYADEGRGLLVYDPDRSPAPQPVELDPGEHTAQVERLAVDPASGEIEEVLGTFEWSFVIQ